MMKLVRVRVRVMRVRRVRVKVRLWGSKSSMCTCSRKWKRAQTDAMSPVEM